MKVADLTKGMVLCISDKEKVAWLTDHKTSESHEIEIKFAPRPMELILPGTVLSSDELIVYLGQDKEPVDPKDPSYKQLVRRVMVREKTAVVLGYNFKYLSPHPEF